jgi:8-oxo-dGTP pyrophosphatase MutT (NUDIX family)
LATGLPGTEAQVRVTPHPRPGWEPGVLPEGCRDGAGLLLLYAHDEEPYFLLTVRRHDLPDHPGQVSLPGGELETGETIEQAAVREAEEEIGADGTRIRVLGRLTPIHIPVSNFILYPVLAITGDRQPWNKQDSEVARILEVPLAKLRDPDTLRVEEKTVFGGLMKVPYFDLDGEKIWGATAMILAEFLWLLGDRPDSGLPQA